MKRASKPILPGSGVSGRVSHKSLSGEVVLVEAELPSRVPKLSQLHGQIIDNRYQLGKKLGEGGMGVVFLADDFQTETKVAIKLIKPELSSEPQLKARFLREMTIAQRIEHPNVVKCLGGGEHNGCFYFIMEYLQGSTLYELLETNPGPKPPERVIPVIQQICEGVQAAHNLGIVHRDLKPENIFIAENGGVPGNPRIKIFDMGLARPVVVGPDQRLTKTGMVLGTPYFMAPEQCSSTGKVTLATDTYATACIAYLLLTGRHVFDGEDHIAIMTGHLDSQPDHPFPDTTSEVEKRIGDVILTALRKSPVDRQATITLFSSQLADALREGKKEVLNYVRPVPLKGVSSDSSLPFSDTLFASSPRHSRRAVLAGLGLAAAGALGLGGYLAIRDKSYQLHVYAPDDAVISVIPENGGDPTPLGTGHIIQEFSGERTLSIEWRGHVATLRVTPDSEHTFRFTESDFISGSE